jgi:class 3 adenylate cyclase
VSAFEALRAEPSLDQVIVEALVDLAGSGSDREIVRINPILFARERGLDEQAVVDVFLHARKLGVVVMEWLFVCPGCGDIVESLASLTAAASHNFCQVCSTGRRADMSDHVEVVFSVAADVRRSPFHDPSSLDAETYFFEYRFASNSFMEGRPVAEHARSCAVACRWVAPGETIIVDAVAEPEYLWFTNGPALQVRADRTDEVRTFDFEYVGTHTSGLRADIAAGPVRARFTNRTHRSYPLLVMSVPTEHELQRGVFLSGTDVLSDQTFLDLFETETVVTPEGLAVARLAIVFTDLERSTEMYDRLGDMQAFSLVRQHFGLLRESVVRHGGAMVKTIGDAVMATFVDPEAAVRAALDMLDRVERFNRQEGGEHIRLKVGIHWGACLAVTLNDRLDYFGQTVNLASRVQSLAHAGEIVMSDDVASQPSISEVLLELEASSAVVQVRGIEGDIAVHRLRFERAAANT